MIESLLLHLHRPEDDSSNLHYPTMTQHNANLHFLVFILNKLLPKKPQINPKNQNTPKKTTTTNPLKKNHKKPLQMLHKYYLYIFETKIAKARKTPQKENILHNKNR